MITICLIRFNKCKKQTNTVFSGLVLDRVKRKLIKYFLLFLLVIPQLEVSAQLDHHYVSGRKAKKQSELFPNKLICLRNKYIFNQKLLKEKNACSILVEKNDQAINLQLEYAKRNRKIRNGSYLIGIPVSIIAVGFIITGISDSFDLFQNKNKEQLAAAENKINIAKGLSILAGTAFVVGTTFSIKNRRAIHRAVKIFNTKY